MRLTALIHRHVTWLVLCALAFVAIAPVIAHGVSTSTGNNWVEVCTAHGIKLVAIDADPAQAPADEHGAPSDCPFCRLQDRHPFIPTSATALILPATITHHAPAASSTLPPRYKPLWAPALSRAPPTFS